MLLQTIPSPLIRKSSTTENNQLVCELQMRSYRPLAFVQSLLQSNVGGVLE